MAHAGACVRLVRWSVRELSTVLLTRKIDIVPLGTWLGYFPPSSSREYCIVLPLDTYYRLNTVHSLNNLRHSEFTDLDPFLKVPLWSNMSSAVTGFKKELICPIYWCLRLFKLRCQYLNDQLVVGRLSLNRFKLLLQTVWFNNCANGKGRDSMDS